MKLRDASSSVRTILFGRPATILPLFLAGLSINLLGQMFPILGLLLCYLLLSGTGRIDAVVTALKYTNLDQFSANPNGSNRLFDAIHALLTPEVITVLLVSVLLMLVTVLVARAVLGAAQVNAVTAALRDEQAISAGIVGAGEDAKAFLLFSLARLATFVVVLVAFSIAGAVLGQGSGLSSALGILVAFVVFVVVSILVYLVFLFVPQAIVIDGVGVRAGLRRSGGFVRHNKARVASYLVVEIGLFGVLAALTAVFQRVGISRVSGIILFFFVLPALGVLKTALSLDSGPVFPTERGSLRGAFSRGVRELGSFVARKPSLFLAALALFALGGVGGWLAAQPFTLETVRPDVTNNVFGPIPVDAFVKIAANNWLVAISSTFAGFGFGVATLVALLFNGALVGIVVGLLPDPTFALALVLPHGIIEIPGLSIAGALGLHLGGVMLSYVRGRTSVEAFSEELVRTYYVVLGLLPVFIVAAFIEAFVTWWVAAHVV